MAAPFSRVAIIGTGLIGGSFALAARPALASARVVGWDKPEVLARAVADGVVDEGPSRLRMPCLEPISSTLHCRWG